MIVADKPGFLPRDQGNGRFESPCRQSSSNAQRSEPHRSTVVAMPLNRCAQDGSASSAVEVGTAVLTDAVDLNDSVDEMVEGEMQSETFPRSDHRNKHSITQSL